MCSNGVALNLRIAILEKATLGEQGCDCRQHICDHRQHTKDRFVRHRRRKTSVNLLCFGDLDSFSDMVEQTARTDKTTRACDHHKHNDTPALPMTYRVENYDRQLCDEIRTMPH